METKLDTTTKPQHDAKLPVEPNLRSFFFRHLTNI